MGLFSRRSPTPRDLVTSSNLGDFGRSWLLKEESGLDSFAVFNALDPLRSMLYTDDPQDRHVVSDELRRHAPKGEWETVGAWQFARDFVQDDEELNRELTDAGLLALARMRVTNLNIHLPPMDFQRYEELTGAPVPNDGFFGPPVFDSHFGPTCQLYFDQAISAAASRDPRRVADSPGTAPGPVADLLASFWDFGMLVLRGPSLVNQEIRFEPSTIKPAREAAANVDHQLFLDAVCDALFTPGCNLFGPWSLMGAARFAEDYLTPEICGSRTHVRLIDSGLSQLTRGGILGVGISVEVLSPFERERL